MRLNLDEKIILVTGGGRGIGKAICESFLNENAKVYFFYASNDESANKFKESVGNAQLYPVKVNINDYEVTEKAVTEILEKEGRIDVLINNAGITRDALFLARDEASWQSVIQTNLMSLMHITSLVSFAMLSNRKGSIVNVGSVAGYIGVKGQTNYCVAKAGVMAFSKALCKELAGKNIRINTVAPGYIETEMTDDLNKKLTKQIPMKRFGTAKEVADTVVFLASDVAGYINGETVVIDGGLIS